MSIIGTGKQECFKSMDHFLSAFKFDVEKRKNIHFEFKDLEIEENIVDDQCVFVYGSVQIYGLYDKEVPMASTTKIMTAMVVIQNTNLNNTVEISKKSAGTGGYCCGRGFQTVGGICGG